MVSDEEYEKVCREWNAEHVDKVRYRLAAEQAEREVEALRRERDAVLAQYEQVGGLCVCGLVATEDMILDGAPLGQFGHVIPGEVPDYCGPVEPIYVKYAALSAPKEGPGLSLFKRPADVVLDCPECNGQGALCLPEWEGMNRPCDYCGGTGSAPKEYNPDMDVDPMHTEDHYNGDELPGMWEKADLIGGETDNIKEDNTCE